MAEMTATLAFGAGATIEPGEAGLDELKSTLEGWGEDSPIKLEYRARWRFKCPATAAVLREIYYWSHITKDRDGWFFKTYESWWQQHGLTRRDVEKGVKRLIKARIVEKKRGYGNRMYFRLFPARFIEELYGDGNGSDELSTERSECRNRANRNAGIEQTGMPESDKPESANPPNPYKSGNEVAPEELSKECAWHTPGFERGGAGDTRTDHGADGGGGARPEVRDENKGNEGDGRHDDEAFVGRQVADLDAGIRERYEDRLRPGQRRGYEKQARAALVEHDRDLVKKAFGHVVGRWPNCKYMPLAEAVADVIDGRDSVPNEKPVRAMVGVERFSPNDPRYEREKHHPRLIDAPVASRDSVRRWLRDNPEQAGGEEIAGLDLLRDALEWERSGNVGDCHKERLAQELKAIGEQRERLRAQVGGSEARRQ